MKLSVDPTSSTPLHVQVEALLSSMIRRTAYRDGKLLPPETELAMKLGISRNTVRAGIDKLVNQGLLVRKAGLGTRVVRPEARTSKMESWESFTREMASQGVEVETFSHKFGLRVAPVYVTKAFGQPRNVRLYRLERVRGFDGKPVVHFCSWFHPRLNLEGNEEFSQPLYDVLAIKCHVQPERSQEQITAVAANKTLAMALDVDLDMPLLRRVRLVTDSGERPIEYAVNHYRTDNFEYTVDIKRKGA